MLNVALESYGLWAKRTPRGSALRVTPKGSGRLPSKGRYTPLIQFCNILASDVVITSPTVYVRTGRLKEGRRSARGHTARV